MKILGIIPARSGSKGVPNKNKRLISGKSLVQRAFECGKESGVLDRIIVSTDDFEILALAQKIGLEVPFVRPATFSTDATPMIEVVNHAIDHLVKSGYTMDAVMLLQPTSPLRTPNHLREAVGLLGMGDSVCSVTELPAVFSPHCVMKIVDGSLQTFLDNVPMPTRRQDAPKAYVRNGTVYLTRTEVIVQQNTFYGANCSPMIMPEYESLSIDTEEDWQIAENFLRSAA
jgi:N-acylneuraminate cytidylyltransferase